MNSIPRLLLLGLGTVAYLLPADWQLFTCAATTKNYVVGAKLLPSGLFARHGSNDWKLQGHGNPFTFSLDYDPTDPSVVYVAAGNGLLRIPRGGTSWRVLTGEDLTEVRDVSFGKDGSLYFSYSAGIRVSKDKGSTWKEIGASLPRRYCDAIRADRQRAGTVVAGCENGLWRTTDDGGKWTRAGASGFQIMRLEQSPHDACFWLAGTQKGGLFVSRDCGATFENFGSIGVGSNIYDIAFDSHYPNRVAIAGWGVGIAISEDQGKTWTNRDRSLPNSNIWSIAFEPGKPNRLYASVHEEAVYVSDDLGVSWRPEGLEGTVVTRMKFLPEVKR